MNNKPSTPKRNRVWNKESGYWVSADNYISFGQRILGRVDLNIYSEKKIGHLKKQHEEEIKKVRGYFAEFYKKQLKEQKEKIREWFMNNLFDIKFRWGNERILKEFDKMEFK